MVRTTDAFETWRPLLQGIAYRMLGTVSDAQDIVQDVFERWIRADRGEVRDARAWLVTVCVRLATNRLRSARARRETYVGPWLPEPLPAGEVAVPAELDESVSLALLVALENLSPTERAAFLLHEVFDYDFDELARILRRSNAACRKLASRARAAVRARRPRFEADPEEHRRVVGAFADALRTGELARIEQVLSGSARLVADGGGKAAATPRLDGAAAIAELLSRVWSGYREDGVRAEVAVSWFNGAPGVLVYEDGRLTTAYALQVAGDRVERIFAHRNPDKLSQLGAGAYCTPPM